LEPGALALRARAVLPTVCLYALVSLINIEHFDVDSFR
jgi:hypothetical protein